MCPGHNQGWHFAEQAEVLPEEWADALSRRLIARGRRGQPRSLASAIAADALPNSWIDLNLRSQPIVKSGHEQIGVDHNPVLDPSSPEFPLGLALQRLGQLRVAVTAPDGAFGQIGLTAQCCESERPCGSVDAGRQAGYGQPSA